MWNKIFSGFGIFICIYLIYSNLDLLHSIADYEEETPKINMQNFFSNKVEGWGMFYAINNAIRSRFHIAFQFNADENQMGTIHSQILFDDDEKIEENFRLTDKNTNGLTFQTTHFPQNVFIKQAGNTFQFQYILSYESDKHYFSNTSLNTSCSLVNKNIALCHGNIKKMGILLGRTFFTLHSLNHEQSFNKI